MEKKFEEDALLYHSEGTAGKTGTIATKPFSSPEELALAYTPGVAAPAIAIAGNRWNAYRYTNKGNLVAVISNGSSVLGLGNIGARASKPVMEGKAMLFKVYADIDAFDIELSDENDDKFIQTVQSLSPTFGGINLEDIKSPDCFYIEKRLKELLDIPVMHDDQHGTAIAVSAALMNACEVAGKEYKLCRIVICGAGAAAISTARMLLATGIEKSNITMVDSKGVITGRREDISDTKREFATDRELTTLQQAMAGADVFIGLSRGNLLGDKDILSMAGNAIIFALANPTPEISYRKAKELRPDAVVATGRSDAPNQINNLLAFPYLFRGALDTLATTINEEMKLAAARAIASIAHNGTQEERDSGEKAIFGKEYIIPHSGDKRLLCAVSSAVARAAMESGVARRPIASFDEYCSTLLCRVEKENSFNSEIIRYKTNKHRHYGAWQKLEKF